jgi:hypothetical protein
MPNKASQIGHKLAVTFFANAARNAINFMPFLAALGRASAKRSNIGHSQGMKI